jgi:chemotaxis methyl-accepting protein methylase
VRLKLLATDVHQASLEHAGAGIYGEEQLQFVSPPGSRTSCWSR